MWHSITLGVFDRTCKNFIENKNFLPEIFNKLMDYKIT